MTTEIERILWELCDELANSKDIGRIKAAGLRARNRISNKWHGQLEVTPTIPFETPLTPKEKRVCAHCGAWPLRIKYSAANNQTQCAICLAEVKP